MNTKEIMSGLVKKTNSHQLQVIESEPGMINERNGYDQ